MIFTRKQKVELLSSTLCHVIGNVVLFFILRYYNPSLWQYAAGIVVSLSIQILMAAWKNKLVPPPIEELKKPLNK